MKKMSEFRPGLGLDTVSSAALKTTYYIKPRQKGCKEQTNAVYIAELVNWTPYPPNAWLS